MEILAYAASDFEGAMTADQIKEKAIEFFNRYSTSSAGHDGKQVITKDEAWRVVSAADYAQEYREKKERDSRYKDKLWWIEIDADHDDILFA